VTSICGDLVVVVLVVVVVVEDVIILIVSGFIGGGGVVMTICGCAVLVVGKLKLGGEAGVVGIGG
jgi:hypothetical protein